MYLRRIKGGILGDGVNSLLAGIFNTFPNTTFGQNNGVIQLTGIASRKVGFFVAGLFVFIGCFPVVGGVLQAIPKPVLGGATLVMFAMVAVGGLKLLASYALDRRSSLVTACALGMAIGVMMVPQALAELPNWLENILLSPVTSAGLTAVILDLTLPGRTSHKSKSETPSENQLQNAKREKAIRQGKQSSNAFLADKTGLEVNNGRDVPKPITAILGTHHRQDAAFSLYSAKTR